MSLCNLNSKKECVWGHVFFFFHTHEPFAVLHHLYITQDEKLLRTAEHLVSKYLQTSHAPFQLWPPPIIMMKKTNSMIKPETWRHGLFTMRFPGFHVPVVISKKSRNLREGDAACSTPCCESQARSKIKPSTASVGKILLSQTCKALQSSGKVEHYHQLVCYHNSGQT